MNILLNNNRLSRQPVRAKKKQQYILWTFCASWQMKTHFLYVSTSGYGISTLKTYGRLPPFLYKND